MPPSRKNFRTLNDYCQAARSGAEGLPDYFDLLRRWVDFDHGAFFMTDAAGRLWGGYHEDHRHAEQAAEFVRRARNGTDERSADDPPSVEALFRMPQPIQLIRFDSRAAQRSTLYREVIAPIGGQHVLRFGVCGQGRPLGLLALVRGRSERGFQQAEIMRVAEAAPPLAQLLAAPVDEEQRRLLREGFLVLSSQGELLQACAEGERLWRMLNHDCFLPRVDAGAMLRSLCAGLRQEGQRSVRRLFSNGWGRFELTAASLHAASGGETAQAIHLRVQQWGLAQVVHLRCMERLQLSSMQKRVCMELLRNQTQTAIAQTLQISPQTVVSHIRDIYNKARVGSRQELLRLFG